LVKECDILVLGAGPAGIAAASCAAEVGKRVILLDDNPHAGGQIWRHDTAKAPAKQAATWIERLQRVRVEILPATQVIAAPTPTTLLAESPGGLTRIHAERIILACGARERFLPFPGWTLPGVFGAGGLQALVKSGYPIAKRRVVVAGSGPLLLAVAAYLRARGADVRLIAEQTPRSLLRFGASLLWNQPGKFGEALGLAWQLRGIPYRTAWPIRAGGAAHLESVTLTDGVKTWTEPCDALACGFGLAPNLELARLLGCDATRDFVLVDAEQQTSIRGIFAVGEMTGVGGLDKALIEGQIAGFCAADRFDRAQPLFHAREKARRFAALLDDTFSLREDLRQLPDDDTIVCRCEDVTFGRLKKHASWRDAKLQTRCGMGPCQGRICGPALQFLFGWTSDSVRPPILPTALANLAALADS
jgi:NADPH-dependent 2,4-dienoyl-CoA reductase/sulfur reductase-like enzyme